MSGSKDQRVSRWQTLCLILVYVADCVCGDIRYSIPEELDRGAFVGNIAKDLGLNVKGLIARRFRIVADHGKQYLDVNVEKGTLFVSEKIDRERLCEQSLAKCVLKMEAVVENPLNLYRVEVEIVDVNDNSPAFQGSEFRLEISETASPGARFRLQKAHDPDSGTNRVRAYQLSDNEHFYLELQTDSEQSVIPELVLQQPLDREEQQIHQLTLTAVDGGIPERSGSTRIVISVFDVNDNAPVFDRSVYQVTTAENVPKGYLIVKVNARDVDEGPNGQVIYSFGDYTADRVRKLFNLDSQTGAITVTGAIDFEQAEDYDISVQAKDMGLFSEPVYSKVLVKITDVNDNTPGDIAKLAFRSYPRGRAYRNCSRSFEMVINGPLDREKVADYNVTIICRDGGFPPLSANQTIGVQVSDTNDNAPRFTQPVFTMYVMENNAVDTSIGSVSACDPDFSENGKLSYSILDSTTQGIPASSLVLLHPDSGIMSAQRSFDYERLKNFPVNIQVRDGGSPPLSSNATVNVIIRDQNDNIPVIVSPPSSQQFPAEESMPWASDPGYLVTKVTATDADSGGNAQLTYRLLHPTDTSLFTVAPQTGEIWSIRNFGNKDSLQQKLVVLVRDNGKPPLSSTVTINVAVLNGGTEHLSDTTVLGNSDLWTTNLRLYLIISFGTISLIFLVVIIILAIKVHRGRNGTGDYRSSFGTVFCCAQRNSPHGIQKASINLQMPPNYPEVYESEAFAQTLRHSVCPTSDLPMNDLMFLKLYGSAAPMINVKTGTCMTGDTGKASNSAATEFREVRPEI
ncbi:protocadherin alpha-C2-like [Callorhinchus milii]|uniref:protocadherin alpha-C2-like n=1 Tax=Callorhinchus milii TaxID=7868 RepID=UPI001C3F94B1|nr:protocadherin alpha-C2-like [Callorhinchus milii]